MGKAKHSAWEVPQVVLSLEDTLDLKYSSENITWLTVTWERK